MKCFTPACWTSWAWHLLPLTATLWELSWPRSGSSTWPGRVASTAVTPAGWLTAACVTPSTCPGVTAEEMNQEYGPFTTTPTAPDSQTLVTSLTPTAIKVGWTTGLSLFCYRHIYSYKDIFIFLGGFNLNDELEISFFTLRSFIKNSLTSRRHNFGAFFRIIYQEFHPCVRSIWKMYEMRIRLNSYYGLLYGYLLCSFICQCRH